MTSMYPWRQYSDDTRALQAATNETLSDLDMPLLGEDGVLGAQTCGAQLYLADLGYPEHANVLEEAECESFSYPPPAGPPTTTPPPVPTETTPRATQLQRRASMGTMGWLLIAGGVAAAGVYLATRSKR